MNMAERLQDLRKKANYSQEELADILGISRQAISKWESEQGKPEVDNIIKLAEIYNVSTDFLLVGKDNTIVIPQYQKPQLSLTAQRTISTIAIIASTAIVTVLFIAALSVIARLG